MPFVGEEHRKKEHIFYRRLEYLEDWNEVLVLTLAAHMKIRRMSYIIYVDLQDIYPIYIKRIHNISWICYFVITCKIYACLHKFVEKKDLG